MKESGLLAPQGRTIIASERIWGVPLNHRNVAFQLDTLAAAGVAQEGAPLRAMTAGSVPTTQNRASCGPPVIANDRVFNTNLGEHEMSEREQYIEKAKARLDQWTAEIDKLKAKAEEADADAKIEYDKQIDELRAQRDEAENKIKELQEASDEAWSDMKSGFDKAWDSMSGAFQSALARFK